MPYKKGKFKCSDCGKDVSRKGVKICRECYFVKERPSKGDKVLQKQQRKDYKSRYYQANKEKISIRNKNKIIPPEKQFSYYIKSKYGISFIEYKNLLSISGYCCEICGTKEPENAKNKDKLCIDHCHNSNEIRGVLCRNCNSALGMFKENIEVIKQSLKYLEKCQS